MEKNLNPVSCGRFFNFTVVLEERKVNLLIKNVGGNEGYIKDGELRKLLFELLLKAFPGKLDAALNETISFKIFTRMLDELGFIIVQAHIPQDEI